MVNKEFSNTENITDFERLIDNEYECWFKKICLQSVIDMCEKDPIVWKGRSLAWDASHEILAYHIFSDKNLTIDNLLFLSNHRYELLDKLWPKGELTKKKVEDFYIKSKEILPWGHGVFIADHNVHERRMNWLRRVRILKMIQKLSIDSICDYGAGGGHTSLLAKAMGFKRIIHHEYSAFHPFVKWRSDQIGNFGYHNKIFELSRAEDGLKLVKPVNAVVCMDVAEHVWDPIRMIEEIYNSLEQDGYLIWNSVFGEGISCHLHLELKGKEEKILTDCGFQRVKELNVIYRGHSGLYKKMKKLKFINMPIEKRKIKPKILFIVDAPNWAHDYKTINLQSQLSDQYDIEKCFCDNIQVEDIKNADIVVIYYWGQLLNENMQKLQLVFSRNKHKLLLGICSHNEMSGSNRSIALKTLKEYASAIFVNNKLLFDEFAPYFDIPVFYTPNGVDTTFYKPKFKKCKNEYLRVGWAGSLKNHGDIRGYYDYILPAVESIDKVELITAAREDFWRNKQQMLEFYNSIDVYICASRSEGTPNPCLEAAACGIPILTTAVGNMPEFIENGVNGIFIKRDIGDIVQKLKLVRDNHFLRSQLSKKGRERALIWDWQLKAENYKHMFEAVLDGKGKKSLFHSYEQVYVASADKMDNVLENCKQFIQVPNRNIDSYVSVIGGMSGLNYLSMMAPHTITFFDINHSAIEYVKCMLEIIDISKGCRDFISRVFCRSMETFLKEKNYEEINFYNQNEYIDMKYDKDLYRELMSALSPFSREMYKKYLRPHLSRKVLSGVKNCRQLVPCYPIYERVPVGGGEENGWNEHGKLVPNLNTFFYGYGWLSSDEAFNHVKTILNSTKKRYIAFDLFRDEIDLLADFSGNVVIHCSNIDDWFSEKWKNWSEKILEKSIKKGGELTLITTNGGVRHSFFDPHTKAFERIKPYVYGKIVEITHKIPWGFHEFKRDTINFYDYLNGNYSISDTTIIHNLVGEGVTHNILEEVCRIALQKSNRVIILEHNQKSLDWRNDRGYQSYITISQLKDILNKITKEINALIHPVVNIPGYNDLSRNIVFIVDTFNSYNTDEYDAEIKYRETKNTLKDFKNYRERIIANIDQTIKLPYDTGRNDNIKLLEKEDTRKIQSVKQKSYKKNKLICEKSDPLVSVIVPTYNRSERLLTAVQSILNQTFKKLEIIVVNDAGQNEENSIAGLNANENITYVRHCRNKGLASARNTGIKISKGKYIAYLDDDDIFYNNHIEKLVNILENTEYKVAYTDAYRAYYLKENDSYTLKNKDLPYSFDFDYDRILIGNFVPVLCFMHEKACLDEVGLFDETLTSHEDWDLWIRLSRKYTFFHIKEVTAEYSWKTDGTTMTSGNKADMFRTMELVYKKHYDLFKGKPYLIEMKKRILESYKKEKQKEEYHLACSIIIPVFNQVNFTKLCLKNLFKVTPRELFEVIVVDNASDDGTKEYLQGLGDDITLISNDYNLGFAKACNQGAKQSRGHYLVFLNNDTLPQPGWLDEMIKKAEKDPLVGIVGSRLLYPDGTIQHAGVYFNEKDIPYHAFRSAPSNHPSVLVSRETPAVTGACMLMPRLLFQKIGGFNEEYHMYVEDVDLCLRTWNAGFKVVYCAESALTHFESASIADVNRRDAQVRVAWNHLHKSWRNKWPAILQRLTPQDIASGSNLDIDTKGYNNSPKEIKVMWHAPIYDPSGYADEARNFILQLQKKKIDPVVREIGRRSDKFRNGMDENIRLRFDEAIAKKTTKDCISIVHFPAYVFERVQNAYYHIGRTTFETDGLPADWVRKCNLMDEIWVPSEFNMQTFKAAGVTSRLFLVPEGVDSERYRPGIDVLEIPGSRGVVFLSIFEWIHRKGWDILLKAWANAFQQDDDVCLVLRTYPINVTEDIGTKEEIEQRINLFLNDELQISREEVAPIIVLTDQISEKDMPRLYAASDAYVLPSRGEGWGRTQMEAMACGLPVLSTRWGGNLEFMNDHNSLLIEINRLVEIDERTEIPFYRGQKWAEPSAENLREMMRKVVENPTEVQEIGHRARLDIERHWRWDRIASIAAKRLRAISAELENCTVKKCGSNEPLRIIWEGSQFVHHSLALVNRELCIELARRQEIELSLIPYEPHEFDQEEDPKRFSLIQERLRKPLSSNADLHIRHQWPPNFTPPKEGHWIMIQPWEYGALPKDWVEPMRSQVDELWVPSNYVREVYIESGIPASKVFVIPNGVDYENFHPKAEPKSFDTEKSFKFLFVGGTITRKGIDVLLDAYSSAFSCVDDVCLVIKDMGADTFYRGQSGAERIEAIQKREDAPEILYLKEDLPDKKMAGLYTACDCLVHPYRGEGFGLPVAEAMACGLPVLITRGGACDDYCNEKNSFLIESNRRPIAMNDTELCNTGWVLEPDKYDLIRRLRFLYEDRDERRKIGAVAAREIRELVSWEKSADLVVQRIKEIKNKPIIRLQVNGCQEFNEDNNSDLSLYTAIQERISIGDIEGAIANLEDLIGNKPELAVAYNDLGVLYHRLGENKLAVARYRRAIDLEPNNTNYRKNLADILAVTFGELEEALQHYVAVLVSDNKDVEALLATGHICARLERYDDAAEFYEKVLEIEPNNSDAANWLGNMREKVSTSGLEGNLNECYQTLLSKIDHEDLAGAIQKIENFIEMYPKHGQAHNDLGVLYYKKESKTKVLACYLKAVELEPENLTFRKNLADFLYVEEGRVEEALENYVEVLRIKPDDVETLLITGHICAAIERFEDAMSFYHKVLKIEPWNTDARKILAALERRQLSMLYKEERGKEKTNDATEINQAESQASVDEVPIEQDGVVEELINKADLLFQQERIDQAVDTMLKAIAVNPSDGRTYVELAGQLVNYGRHENALEVLAEMPTNQPVAVAMQKMLVEGYAEEGMGNYAAAKKCSDGVLAREPKDAKALNLNGILAYRNGDNETAEHHFKRAIELSPEYGEPYTNLGALVWEKGDPKMASEHYERGFFISPTDIGVANAYHEVVTAAGEYKRAEKVARSVLNQYPQCRKVLYLLIDTLIRQEKTEEALNELENALSTFGIDEGLLDTALALRERIGKTKKTGSAKKPGVSLCMIVKDEEANLARCLASVKPIVDEMVVVDTGSTDRTRDIAEFFGARVYEFEWNDNFSEARNSSLSKATGSWILIMDADEMISHQDYNRFRKLTAKKPLRPVAYSIVTRNYCNMANIIGWNPNEGKYPKEEAAHGWLSSEKVRLFSNNKIIKFEGAVHEMVDAVLKNQGIVIKKCDIPVHHYGRLDTDKLDQKSQTYYEIGKKKLDDSRGDIGAVRELAIQATILKKNAEAIELWKMFLALNPDDKAASEAYVNMVTAYIRMKDYTSALSSAKKAVELGPDLKEAQYNLAFAELLNGDANDAIRVLKKILRHTSSYPPAEFLLSAALCCKGENNDGFSSIKNSKQYFSAPSITCSIKELAVDLMAADQVHFSCRLLQTAIDNEIIDDKIMTLFSACLKKINEFRGVGGEICRKADMPKTTVVYN